MKRKILGYCYICQKQGPCHGDDKCCRLPSGPDRAKAYREGYYAKHASDLIDLSMKRYREENPDSRRKRTTEQRAIDQARKDQLRKEREEKKRLNPPKDRTPKMTHAERVEMWRKHTELNGDKRSRWKKTLKKRSAIKRGREAADKEAD